MINRNIAKKILDSTKSILLLGPRQTGKSTLIQSLHPELSINLIHEPTFLAFVRNPGELEERIDIKKYKTVFIDEVQRLPSLLNTIQSLIDTKGSPKFLLTGSSARKLKRGHANLLPGRIHTYFLDPISCVDAEYQIKTEQAMETGLLPGIYTEKNSSERIKTLQSYASTYLKEEIQAEALTKNLEGFSRFLFTTATFNGNFVDHTKVSSESSITRQSAMRFFEILEDTMIIKRCESFSKKQGKRLVQHPKYYFFDIGVLNALLGNFEASNDRKGMLFEALFFNQLWACANSLDISIRVSTFRTNHGAEVDFIVEIGKKVWAIELKASNNISKSDLRGFRSFQEFYQKSFEPLVAITGSVRKKIDQISILPWQDVLHLIFREFD